MKFGELSKYLEELEKTSSRIEITKILAKLFKASGKDEIDKTVYLLLGRLAPKYENVVFNLAERMMLQVLAEAYRIDLDDVREAYKQKGDLGLVAEGLAKGKGSDITVAQVFEALHKIALDEGKGSQERKVKEAAKLLSKLDSLGARFVARIPVGKLRLGFSDKTIIDALSWMLAGDKSRSSEIEKIYHSTPDVGALAKAIKEGGVKRASKASISVGIPALPMLAQRLKSPKEMIEKMKEVAVEPKLDGLRLLVHYKSGKDGFVKSFTRNLNETSWMFPELAKIGKSLNAKEIILDAEAIGMDEKQKRFANFQTTMTRRRKHGVSEKATKVPIKFYFFDILFKNGKNLMQENYLKRRKALESSIKPGGAFQLVEYIITKDPEKIIELGEKYQKEGLEGIIVKRVGGKYVPGRTGWRWVKMKEAEDKHAKLSDTVDAVVLGYTRGRGRRAVFGVGQFLAGIQEKGKISTITKVGTGITDEQFRELAKRLEKLEVKEKPKQYDVHKDLEPDFWVRPSLVVELAADEITKSPKHTSGFALRFPRLIKFRDDKSIEQATTTEEMKNLFDLQ